MRLSATLTTAEIQSLAHSLLPLRIDLRSDPDDDPRWLDIVEPIEAKLIPDVGLSLATRVTVRWPERALFDEFRVDRLELQIEPRLESRDEGGTLVVGVEIGDLDVAWVPHFVSEAVVNAVNERIGKSKLELRWDFSGTLSVSFDQPGEHSNIERVCLDLRTAKLDITAGGVQLEAPMNIEVKHEAPEDFAQRMH